ARAHGADRDQHRLRPGCAAAIDVHQAGDHGDPVDVHGDAAHPAAHARTGTPRVVHRRGGGSMKRAKKAPSRGARPKRRVVLLVATGKGAWLYQADSARRTWRVDGPHLLGNIAYHLVLDPRDRRTLLMASKTGHLGPTVFRSQDLGRSWKEAARPPAFPK